MKIDKEIFVSTTLVFLAIVLLLGSIYGLYFRSLTQTLGAIFFMIIGLRIIKEFLKNEAINLGVSAIDIEDNILLRLSIFVLGSLLYAAGIYHLIPW